MTTAIFSLLGIVTGALLQYFFTRHLDLQRSRREARTKAYTDYLLCVSEHANTARHISLQEVRNLAAKTADAKCRICLYGSSSVIEAFAAFEKQGATMNTAEQRASFTHMVSIMRRDSTNDLVVTPDNLQVVLLGADPMQPKH